MLTTREPAQPHDESSFESNPLYMTKALPNRVSLKSTALLRTAYCVHHSSDIYASRWSRVHRGLFNSFRNNMHCFFY